ncbi:MAG: FAD-dependent monooxygenase, partial [Cyclobacteriaceae bacterium]
KKLDLNNPVVVIPRRRSIDARGRKVMVNFLVDLVEASAYEPQQFIRDYPAVHHSSHRVIIIGSGPAGLFAALRLIELGVKPIVLERGKDVQARRRDIAAINKDHVVHPDSNYCFGEGGAGTYS